MNGSGFAFLPPEWEEEASSTNDVLKDRLASAAPPPSGTVFAAKRQTKGKGRLGTVWRSARAGDLTFSFVWKGAAPLEDAGALPFACGLAVRDFLREFALDAQCKWPNDVFVEDAKICGILVEGGSVPAGGIALVAGIGVNVARQTGLDSALGRKTASMEQHLGRAVPPETLLPRLLQKLAQRLTAWQENGIAALLPDLEQALWGRGKSVRVKTAAGIVEGIVAGLGEKGELLVRTGGDQFLKVSSVAALEGL